MRVKMKDDLAAASVHVDKKTVTRFGYTEITCYLPGHSSHVTEEMIIIWDIVESGNVFLGHDQNMNGGSRISILKSHNGVIFIDLCCLQSACNDVTEYAIAHEAFDEPFIGGFT